MAARKHERPVPENDLVQGDVKEKNDMGQAPAVESAPETATPETAVSETEQSKEEEQTSAVPKGYVITCRNKVTKEIGGVKFNDGVGRTDDAFAASWFASKDGYTVEPGE